jgi:hypothetical protein
MKRTALWWLAAAGVLLCAATLAGGAAARKAAPTGDAGYSPTGGYPTITGRSPPAPSGNVRVDDRGIPIVYYEGVGWRRNPGTVAAFGLGWYGYWLTSGDRHALVMARTEADWLLRNQQRRAGTWVYAFPFEVASGLRVASPWTSAYAQGVAISLLTRVWHATGNRAYLTSALAATSPLERSFAHGGLVTTLFGRRFFYLEYPTRPPTLTVNGLMATLVGLYDLSRAAPRSEARRLFVGGLRTLRFALPLYDLPDGSQLYDLSNVMAPPRAQNLAGPGYLIVDAAYLRALTSMAPNPVFRFYADRWSARAA